MTLDEPSARRVVLVQAIETVDSEGRLIGPAEMERTEKELLAGSGASEDADELQAALLVQRADRLLAQVESREPQIAALAQPSQAAGWLLWGLPALTLLLGLMTDRIADPHKVDLLSQPLLAIVLWNLAMYALLLLAAVRPRTRHGSSAGDALRRWAAGLRLRAPAGRFREDIRLVFLRTWESVSAPLHHWRVARALHLAAAGWAAGVALSLIARGAVVEYRVGWESTWFGASQVHAFLEVLLMPAVLLLGVAPLSLEEVAQLEVSRDSVAGAGRRWVYLYATLLAVMVIVPRLLLGAFARWRERRQASALVLDMRQPYFERLVGRLRPARVRLALRTDTAEDRQAMLRVLWAGEKSRSPQPAGGAVTPRVLARAGDGDLLQLLELPAAPLLSLPAPSRGVAGGVLALARRVFQPVPQAPELPDALLPRVDVVLQVVSAPVHLQATPLLRNAYGRPVLLLVRPVGTASERAVLLAECERARDRGQVEVLAFGDFARCWVQEDLLLSTVSSHLPAAKAPGMDRLRRAWARRHQLRLEQAMVTIALELTEAARETEEVRSPALSLRDLLPAERRAGELARKLAIACLVERLQRSAELTLRRLLELHGIDPAQAQPLELRLEEKFVVQGAVNTPQAGLAGAATGAAMGASVDLMVGGLTLGAAAALGALVGGGAATVAAAWKNKSTGPVSSVVTLGDEMLEGLARAALLRYLAAAHFGRLDATLGGAEVEARWQGEVAAVLESRRDRFKALWVASRAGPVSDRARAPGVPDAAEGTTAPLADLLEEAAMDLLRRLYPAARSFEPAAS